MAWIVASCVSLLTLNYQPQTGFYCSFLAFLAISFCLRMAYKKEWLERAGLLIPLKELIIGIVLAVLITATFYFYITGRIDAAGISFQNRFELGNPQLYVFTVFQTLNEEIIAGALLLFSLEKKWPVLNPLALSAAAALVFSGAHYLIYSYVFDERSIIYLPALISLFAAGIIRNNAILVCGHIGFSWMLHLSWNLVFFGGRYSCGSGKECTQACLFNLIMGDFPFVIMTALLAVAASVILVFFSRKREGSRHPRQP